MVLFVRGGWLWQACKYHSHNSKSVCLVFSHVPDQILSYGSIPYPVSSLLYSQYFAQSWKRDWLNEDG